MGELKKTSLIDLTKEAQQIIWKMEEQAELNDGVINEALALRSEKNAELFNNKALRGGFAVLRLKQEADFIKARMDELKARQARLKNAEDSLKNYLKHCMEVTGNKAIESDLISMKVRGQAIWPVIEQPELVPSEFCTGTLVISGDMEKVKDFYEMSGVILAEIGLSVKLTNKPDKSAVKEALKEGKLIPGAFLPSHASSLIIK